MTEDERQDLLRTVAESHASLSEVALKLRRHRPPKAPALKTAIQAERGAFHLKRTLQQLVVEDLEHANEGKSLPELRRGCKGGLRRGWEECDKGYYHTLLRIATEAPHEH